MFTVEVGGERVAVEYTRDYFALSSTDHFQFRSPADPPRPLPISPSGYLSHFAPGEQVDALGGPEAFARRYAEEVLAGRGEGFRDALEGWWPKTGARGTPNRRAKTPTARLPAGGHGPPSTAPPAQTPGSVRPRAERTLFDECDPPE